MAELVIGLLVMAVEIVVIRIERWEVWVEKERQGEDRI